MRCHGAPSNAFTLQAAKTNPLSNDIDNGMEDHRSGKRQASFLFPTVIRRPIIKNKWKDLRKKDRK
jgi:hypothetical protein